MVENCTKKPDPALQATLFNLAATLTPTVKGRFISAKGMFKRSLVDTQYCFFLVTSSSGYTHSRQLG